MKVLVLVEHDRGSIAVATLEALTFARSLESEVHAVTVGAVADGLSPRLAEYGVTVVHQAHHELLTDYGPDAWADAVASLITTVDPSAVIASGTDRGNEVLAQVAARLDLPFAANVLAEDLTPHGDTWDLNRVRWGGSLHERATLTATVKLFTVAPHAIEPSTTNPPGLATPTPYTPVIADSASITIVRDRVERVAGQTLATAAVVIGGGRGVGSAEGFAPLEDLAAALDGVVGCSRAVTNNGWRNHADQVGQTGTRITADVYFACGISGAIQHWVGASGAKCIIAINTDASASMVTKAHYAVIGDLHEVIPALTAEVRARKT